MQCVSGHTIYKVCIIHSQTPMRRMKPQRLKAFACSASAGITYFIEISHISKNNAAHEAAGAKLRKQCSSGHTYTGNTSGILKEHCGTVSCSGQSHSHAARQRAIHIGLIYPTYPKNIAAQKAAAAKSSHAARSGHFK